ncbi:bis-aminopropyl spermidine synthase family protein [Rhizohabitans arisaemae]|uniref:bis-aminopropyl spermidine synthase family protein n=1 Tax=Rhizohabitans arisaemae TaxID=2720610 RepID=UPI0024B05ED3|nr:bis-aminopropyl spermidine synthase family protein [Rhizohabitans arisaemae]
MTTPALSELLSDAGVDARRLRHALALLADGRWWTVGDLVRETATSRRTVEALLRTVELDHEGDRFRLTRSERYDDQALADPVGHLLAAHAETVASMERLIARGPRGRARLDHVSATAETVVRRALLLGARFWLPGSRILFVGDHDLTSVAVSMIHPEAEVLVVDIDDRILRYIAEVTRDAVTCRWADLRLGLAPSAAGWADLTVTDPPYSPGGVGLFLARSAEALRDREHGRLVLAYGVSERTPALALKVQETIVGLNLATEAMWPDFNRYHGAQAIGSAADLYVLRPTSKTWPAIAGLPERLAIYTQGPQSVESTAHAGTPLGTDLVDFLKPSLLVGDWPPGDLPRTRLSTWLARPFAADVDRVAVAVPAGLTAAFPRLLLASRSPHVDVVSTEPVSDLGFLSSVYKFAGVPGRLSAVRLPRPDPATPEAIVRRVLDNAHGKVPNNLREGLIAYVRATGGSLTKNQARALVAECAPWAEGATALELPLHRLRELPEVVAHLIERLTAGSGDG